MLLRIVKFQLSTGHESKVQPMAEDLVANIKQQPGCLGVFFFSDAGGESGIAALWQSRDHANAAASMIRPKLDAHLAGQAVRPPEVGLFPVIAGWIAK
jgi:hypothetical protein